MTADPDLLTYEEAATYLRVKVQTLRCWVCRHQIPYIRITGRLVRFRRAALAEWLAAKEHPAHDQAGPPR